MCVQASLSNPCWLAEYQSVRKDLTKQTDLVSSRVEKLVSNAQELIGSAS